MKIVINTCWGGFGLSNKAKKHMGLGSDHYCGNIKRDDKKLVAVVEELGKEANGSHAKLRIVEIPDDVDWYIDDYDGRESVHEKHRSW